MGRRGDVAFAPETVHCHLCGASQTATLPALEREGWDWFRGWFPRRVMFCPSCMKDRRPDRDRLLQQSQVRPERIT
jgi:hypothetical protein